MNAAILRAEPLQSSATQGILCVGLTLIPRGGLIAYAVNFGRRIANYIGGNDLR